MQKMCINLVSEIYNQPGSESMRAEVHMPFLHLPLNFVVNLNPF